MRAGEKERMGTRDLLFSVGTSLREHVWDLLATSGHLVYSVPRTSRIGKSKGNKCSQHFPWLSFTYRKGAWDCSCFNVYGFFCLFFVVIDFPQGNVKALWRLNYHGLTPCGRNRIVCVYLQSRLQRIKTLLNVSRHCWILKIIMGLKWSNKTICFHSLRFGRTKVILFFKIYFAYEGGKEVLLI